MYFFSTVKIWLFADFYFLYILPWMNNNARILETDNINDKEDITFTVQFTRYVLTKVILQYNRLS